MSQHLGSSSVPASIVFVIHLIQQCLWLAYRNRVLTNILTMLPGHGYFILMKANNIEHDLIMRQVSCCSHSTCGEKDLEKIGIEKEGKEYEK